MSTNETNASDPGREVQPAMSIAGGPGGLVHEPIHESLTLTALISAGFGVNNGTNFGNASNADWEYIRGAVWNDDPNLLLFEDEPDTNHTYSTGLTWTYWYKTGASQWSGTNKDPARWKNPTGRSHYGDLQFLHCMASDLGEQPAVTKQKIMTWLEVLYQLANGEGITPDTLVSATKLSQFCPDGSLPPSWKPFSYLFGKESSFNQPDYTKRALGSMLHFIQDSYALGHTRRTLLNPQDKASDNPPLSFKPGTTDRWGAIENFHTYEGEDDSSHSHYDHSADTIPDQNNLGNLDQWNGLLGCRDAVDKCIKLLNLKRAGTKWNDGVAAFFDQEVLPISPNATPADTRIWP